MRKVCTGDRKRARASQPIARMPKESKAGDSATPKVRISFTYAPFGAQQAGTHHHRQPSTE